MNVNEAVAHRMSVRSYRSDPVPGAVVREILETAHRAPSGGNLQPWRVYALAGDALAELKGIVAAAKMEQPQYPVYPDALWDPFRRRRYECGEDLYAAIGIAREDKAGRYRQLANNLQFFGAPVGLFFCLERKLGSAQWSDVGMYMQTVMLLAVEHGLDTCAQEFWANYGQTVARFLNLPDDQMVFAGMALGYRDPLAPINQWRTRRDPFADWAEMRGFD